MRELIDFHTELGHPKVQRRIFPLCFEGGGYKWFDNNGKDIYRTFSAVKEDFSKEIKQLSEQEFIYLRTWLKNRLYWQNKENRFEQLEKKPFKSKYVDKIKENTWRINYLRIYNTIRLYSDNQQEANYWEKILFDSHIRYLEYIRDFTEKLEKEKELMNK